MMCIYLFEGDEALGDIESDVKQEPVTVALNLMNLSSHFLNFGSENSLSRPKIVIAS